MPSRSRQNDIWAIYQKYDGALSLDRLAHYCWEEGVWTEEEKHTMAFAAAKRQCQQVLSRKTATGLPVAGPTQKYDHGDRIWRQTSLWDYADARYNLGMRLKQSTKDHEIIEAIHHYMQERFGEAPPILRLVPDDPDAPLWWEDLDNDVEEDL